MNDRPPFTCFRVRVCGRHRGQKGWGAAAHPALVHAAPPSLGLVCFRHVDGDEASKRLLETVNATGEAFLTHTLLSDRYVLRVAVGGTWTTAAHVERLADLLDELA